MWILAAVLARPVSLWGGSSDPMPGEFELKAVFVLNFVRLVNWENAAGEDNPADLPICAPASSDFASAIRQAAAGKTVGNRSISFKITSRPSPSQCRTLIFDSAQYSLVSQILRDFGKSPTLTVGNGPGFLALGGMFELVVEDRKVQFDASLEAVRRTKLDVSARLLQLSRNLRKGTGVH